MSHALSTAGAGWPPHPESPWKEALECYFEECMAFFFAQAHRDIEWSRGYEFLDKELQQVTPDAALGPRRVDKLVKVWRTGGDEAWVLVHYELWGCRAGLTFPVVKLLDYREQWSALEESRNPFATVVMAHLKAQETRRDAAGRQAWKLSLTRRLYERGYAREEVLNLFRFIDWVLRLPEEPPHFGF